MNHALGADRWAVALTESERFDGAERGLGWSPSLDNYPLFAKRPPLDHGYLEAFNCDNVQLIDIKTREPIVEVTETGVRTTRADYEFDIIVLATGFKAYTGALEAFPIRGLRGQTLMAGGDKVNSWMMGANRDDNGARVII